MTTPATHPCGVADCPKDAFARGWCQKHYTRWRRYGSPTGRPVQRDRGECAADGCDSQERTRGWCNAHYKRWLRWGDPHVKRPTTPAEARFWAKVEKNGPTPSTYRHRGTCWQWTAGTISTGYGMFHPTKSTQVLSHRYAYEQVKGPIPDGLVIDHLCRNRLCVNPAHLEAVTLAVNTRRGLSVSTFNALKTDCPASHPYSPENTYVSPKGSRICRACARERDRKPHRNATLRRRITKQHNERKAA